MYILTPPSSQLHVIHTVWISFFNRFIKHVFIQYLQKKTPPFQLTRKLVIQIENFKSGDKILSYINTTIPDGWPPQVWLFI